MAEGETREQKAARYRTMAEEAEAFAQKARFIGARNEYLRLAAAWRALAAKVDRES